MNPFDMWYEEKEHIRRDMDTCFESGVEVLLSEKLIDNMFAEDLKMLYNDGIVREKTQAITVVEALEQLFVNERVK